MKDQKLTWELIQEKLSEFRKEALPVNYRPGGENIEGTAGNYGDRNKEVCWHYRGPDLYTLDIHQVLLTVVARLVGEGYKFDNNLMSNYSKLLLLSADAIKQRKN